MTVKLMTDGSAVSSVQTGTAVRRSGVEEEKLQEKPFVYTADNTVYEPVHTYRRRKNGSFGDILFAQLILSALLILSVWTGSTFGDPGIKAICESIAELFR
ncbi:MAG: hypothetical protein IK990_04600 [Ruminiclostridium sp.]|nr:hypothetical protein [Ruminiclostridium sp.]